MGGLPAGWKRGAAALAGALLLALAGLAAGLFVTAGVRWAAPGFGVLFPQPQHAWVPKCDKGLMENKSRELRFSIECAAEGPQMGVVVRGRDHASVSELRREAEAALGFGRLSWSEPKSKRSFREFLELAGVERKSEATRWASRSTPWVGGMASWGAEELGELAWAIIFGAMLLTLMEPRWA